MLFFEEYKQYLHYIEFVVYKTQIKGGIYKMKKILIVDDEEQILKSLVRLFRRTNYEVLTALDGEKALEIMSKETIDLIISDMRMPKMDGYQLLSLVKERYPKVFRVILSGYAEEKLLFQALQKNIAKIYIFKPWENKEIIDVIDQIFEVEEILEGSSFLKEINNIEELPTIKNHYQRLVSLIDSGAELKEISLEIEKDISIAARVLHLANSAYYNVKTGSIQKAAAYLGIQNISNIIISTSIIDTLDVDDAFKEKIEMLWKHAFLTNKLLIYIYDKFLCKKLEEAYSTAGLLMNVGMVFMYKCFHKKYFDAITEATNKNLNILDLEKELFNITHQEVGGYLLKWWELPYPIVEAALFHHRPLDERITHKELICAVYIADKYSLEILKENCLYDFNEEVFSYLHIEKDDFETKLGIFIQNINLEN